MNNSLRWLWLSLLIILIDQASKYYVLNHFYLGESLPIFPGLNLTLAFNTGSAFSLLANAGGWQWWFFIAIGLLVSGIIFYWLAKLPATEYMTACGLSLVVGGALGNLIDRVSHGYVIDFIDVYLQTWHWPTFNIADSAIVIGVVLLILPTLMSKKEKKRDSRSD